MPTLDKQNIAEGSRCTIEGDWIVECTVRNYITGLTADAWTVVGDAIAFMQSQPNGVPWSAHPGYGIDLRLIGYYVEIANPRAVFLDCIYRNEQWRTWNGMSALRAVQTDKDRDGIQVTVTCTGSTTRPIVESEQVQAGVLTVLKPDASLVVTRLRPTMEIPSARCSGWNQPTDAFQHQLDYVGKTNQNQWGEWTPRSDVGTWIIESINFDTSGNGSFAWNVTYQLRYNKNGWNPEVVYIDRRTGEPHPDATYPNARKIVPYYDTAPFENLKLVEPLPPPSGPPGGT